jgi:hypothetical protein
MIKYSEDNAVEDLFVDCSNELKSTEFPDHRNDEVAIVNTATLWDKINSNSLLNLGSICYDIFSNINEYLNDYIHENQKKDEYTVIEMTSVGI